MTCQSYTRQIHHRTATRRELRFNPRNHAAQKGKRPKRITERFTDPRPKRRIDPRENQQPKKTKPSMIAYIPIPEHNPPEEHTPTKFTSHPARHHPTSQRRHANTHHPSSPRQTPPNITQATEHHPNSTRLPAPAITHTSDSHYRGSQKYQGPESN